MQTRYTVSTVIHTPPEHVFGLLAEPAEHRRLDATGMVGAPETVERLTGVGQVFVMNMTYRSGDHVEHYQTDNHVTAIDAPRLVEWATAPHEGPLLGWRWRYELESVEGGTRVTLTYDWSETSPENIDRFGVPLTDEDGLRASLELLAKAVAAR